MRQVGSCSTLAPLVRAMSVNNVLDVQTVESKLGITLYRPKEGGRISKEKITNVME